MTTTSLMRRVDAHFATLGFSNLNHLTKTLPFLALSRVFLSCWNEQKYPLTRMEEVFILPCSKRTVMCLCRVIGHSGQVDRTHRVVHPETQCLSCDRTLDNVRSALTGRVRVTIFPLWNLTGVNRTLALSVRSLTSQRPVTPDDFTLIK